MTEVNDSSGEVAGVSACWYCAENYSCLDLTKTDDDCTENDSVDTEDSNNAALALAIAVPVALVVAAAAASGFLYLRSKHQQDSKIELEDDNREQYDRDTSEKVEFDDPGNNIFIIKKKQVETGVRFGTDEVPIEVDLPKQEKVILENKGGAPFSVEVYLPNNCDKFTIECNKKGVHTIAPGKKLFITFTITVKCTTTFSFILPIAIATKKKGPRRHFELSVDVESALSSKIDYDDLAIGKMVGEGAFGAVYKGKYKGNSVAIKEYRSGIALEETVVNEIINEISIMEKLRSPFIVSFYGMTVGKHNSIVMELAVMGSLASVLERHGSVSYAHKARIALDCARGMAFLHSNRIIHRDLKPENLLVFSLDLDSPQLVKITDFGTSRMITDEIARNYTQNVGTPIYTSPEILNNTPYSQSTDVYSFGLLLWTLYTQKMPYSEEELSTVQVVKYVLDGNRPTIPSKAPADYKEIMTSCWSQDPEERPLFENVIEDFGAISKKAQENGDRHEERKRNKRKNNKNGQKEAKSVQEKEDKKKEKNVLSLISCRVK
jgi:tRNA A-37 threonylcarbamoyl transferase component Bud32